MKRPPHRPPFPNLLAAALLAVAAALFSGGCASTSNSVTALPQADGRGFAEPARPDSTPRPTPSVVDRGTPDAWSRVPGRQRSGLATTFGERRDSSVRPTTFRRRDASPREQASIFYNNRDGLDAMMSGLWGKASATNQPVRVSYFGELQVGVRGADGAWLPAWIQSGRTLVEGRSGERYAIVLSNRSPARREVVVSVDGLDALDGQPASLRKRGYILDPGQEFAVEGFRTGPDTVAAFRFGSVEASYSNQRHGTARNVGVIGIAVFEEKDPESERRLDADPFPRAWATPPGR